MKRITTLIQLVVELVKREPVLTSALLYAVVGAGSPLLASGTTEHGIVLAVVNVAVALAGGTAARSKVWNAASVARAVQQALVANVKARSK